MTSDIGNYLVSDTNVPLVPMSQDMFTEEFDFFGNYVAFDS